MKKFPVLRGVLQRDILGASSVFVFAAALLWWLAAQRLVWIMDEGIYLEGACRILAGRMPYRGLLRPDRSWYLLERRGLL